MKAKSIEEKILEAIPRTEAATFNEFCNDYSDTPVKGDKSGWATLFRTLTQFDQQCYIEIEEDDSGRISTLRLTESGAARLRKLQKDWR